jgi:site-specific DNA-methyltransferase (adenine-specific)
MSLYYQDPQCTIYNGDAKEVMAEMPEHSVDMIITSPPYFGLRKYKAPDLIFDNDNGCEHEFCEVTKSKTSGSNVRMSLEGGCTGQNNTATKLNQMSGLCPKCGAWRGQLGLEPTPELYIKHLCDIFDACRTVLKKTGTLWVNIDDSYAGSGKGFGDKKATNKNNAGSRQGLKADYSVKSVLFKSLIAIPARFQIEMINRGWICRHVIIWHKGNAMPESVRDRFTNDFEYLFMFSQSKMYFFEQQFEKQTGNAHSRGNGQGDLQYQITRGSFYNWKAPDIKLPLGRNKRSVWRINTKGYKEAHFATFPNKLCTIPILAGCPEFICTTCNQPRMKLYKKGFISHKSETHGGKVENSKRLALLRQASRANGQEYTNSKQEVGSSDCGCTGGVTPGVVMDIFGGSGTVAEEARRLGRKSILIDISEEYCQMAVNRITKLAIPLGMR